MAKEIELNEKFENMGAQMKEKWHQKANDNAGDGTTTATVLAQSIVKHMLVFMAGGITIGFEARY